MWFSIIVNSSFIGDSMLPLIHYEDIVNATDNFSTEKIIGRGGFGIVYEGIWKNTKVAIKRIIKVNRKPIYYECHFIFRHINFKICL